MMRRFLSMTAVVVMGTLLTVAYAGDTKEELKKRMVERLEKINKYKKDGKIGETYLGKIEAVKSEYLKTQEIKDLVANENSDRDKLYKLLAKELSTDKEKITAEQVAKNAAAKKLELMGDDEYFKAKDGKWRQKKDMKKKKKK